MGNRRGSATGELAVLISVVLAAAIGMQVVVKRALQARSHDAADYLSNIGGDPANAGFVLNKTSQYEPYTGNQAYGVDTNRGTRMTFKTGITNRITTADTTTRTGFSSSGTAADLNADNAWR